MFLEDREYTNYIENMYDELIIESVENILNVLTDDKPDDRQCLNAVRRAEQEFIRKINEIERFRDAHYDYTHPDAFRDYLNEDITAWGEIPEGEQAKENLAGNVICVTIALER